MRFVVDETSWIFDGVEPETCIDALETMLDRLDDARELGHGCCYSEDLFSVAVRDGRTFYELYDADSPIVIPPDVRQRIAVAFNHLPVWQELSDPWPNSFDAFVGEGGVEYAPSIAWAHAQTLLSAASAVACISHGVRRESGLVDVTVSSRRAPVWFVSQPRDCERYFRWLIVKSTANSDEMEALSASAFRSLDFVAGSFNGIRRMSKPYVSLVPVIVRHLAALSDEGKRIFSGPRDRVAAEFGPFGVDISDENGNTKSNQRARAERTLVVNGETRIFWWHSKLERHQDRIHICPEKIREGGRILIGIFCDHLTV
jgi:hypothetical protein